MPACSPAWAVLAVTSPKHRPGHAGAGRSAGAVEFQTDLFALPNPDGTSIMLEYTCFCAIDPQRRVDYVTRVAPAQARRAVRRWPSPGHAPRRLHHYPQCLADPFIDQGFDRACESPPTGSREAMKLLILRKPWTTA
jgi:hypothetical protein